MYCYSPIVACLIRGVPMPGSRTAEIIQGKEEKSKMSYFLRLHSINVITPAMLNIRLPGSGIILATRNPTVRYSSVGT